MLPDCQIINFGFKAWSHHLLQKVTLWAVNKNNICWILWLALHEPTSGGMDKLLLQAYSPFHRKCDHPKIVTHVLGIVFQL